jgi:signal transduction histidine kinase
LILSTISVIALSMLGFGAAMFSLHRSRIQSEIDAELMRRLTPPPRPGFERPGLGGPGGPEWGKGFGRRLRGPDDRLSDIEFWRQPGRLDQDGKLIDRLDRPIPDPEAVTNALQGEITVRTREFQGELVRVATIPWRRNGEIVGAAQTLRELGDFEFQRSQEIQTFLILLPVAMLVAGVAAWFIANRALRPVEEMRRSAEKIEAEDLSQRLPVAGTDELGTLAQSFNGFIHRLESAFERERRFTADAAHELRTPLSRIRLATSAALERGEDLDGFRRATAVSQAASVEMSSLLDDLLLLAKADAGQLHPIAEVTDLRVAVREACDDVMELGEERLKLELADEPQWVQGPLSLIKRAVANYLDNARRFSPADACIVVRTLRDEGFHRVVVRDSGPGMGREQLSVVFERFSRIDGSRQRDEGGSGLGLAIVKSIVESCGGRVAVESELGLGTSFEFFLPVAHR